MTYLPLTFYPIINRISGILSPEVEQDVTPIETDHSQPPSIEPALRKSQNLPAGEAHTSYTHHTLNPDNGPTGEPNTIK